VQTMMKEVLGTDIKIPFPRLAYDEAQTKYSSDKPDMRKDLNTDFAFVWVTDFPLFKYDDEEKRWVSEHHPFTAPRSSDIEILEKTPDKVKSRSYDLVLNGSEIASGSIRIHNQQLQERIFNIIGIDKEQAHARFGFLLEAFQYGAPPHGGIALGLDRLLAIFSGEPSIREVITFPKTQKGFCPLTSSPSGVDEKQLRELGLIIKSNTRR